MKYSLAAVALFLVLVVALASAEPLLEEIISGDRFKRQIYNYGRYGCAYCYGYRRPYWSYYSYGRRPYYG